ncbi:SinR family protein [Pseudomonas protegens]|uniref:SinR family protein n=1 Tax=Pseudomonas protegens TaxID=380021 RepID=UPI0012D72C11|nr:SinR family protein [Pseudomonas protegens]
MAVFFIGYDLIKPGKDYSKIVPAIQKTFPNYWHCLDSTWLVNTNHTAQQIADYLLQFIDGNDRLLVAPVSRGAVWTTSFNKGCQDWLRANM